VSAGGWSLRASLGVCGLAIAWAVAGCSADAPLDGSVDAATLAGPGAGNPTVAVDPRDGTVFVAWVDGPEGARDVFLSRAGSDGRASEPVRVNEVPGDATLHEAAPPQVALGPGGEVYVAWESAYPVEGRRFNASNLRFARSLDGGTTFGATVTVNSDGDGLPSSHTFHNMAVAPDGSIYLSWIDGRARDRARLELARASTEAAHAGGEAHHGHGGHEADLPGSELWVAVSRDGGSSFREIAVVDRDVCPCCRTGLATGPDGSVYVAWRKIFEGEVRDIAIARSMDGGATFDAPRPVHRDGWVFPGCPHAGPGIAVASDGSVHVAWYTGRDGAAGTYYAASRDGGRTFGAPQPLLVGEWVPPSLATVAAVGDRVWVAWDDRRAEPDKRTIHVARAEGGRLVERSTLAGSVPDLALAAGVRAVAWQQGGGVRLITMGD
jgi:hypothetical protein